jgi:hypothetical protein
VGRTLLSAAVAFFILALGTAEKGDGSRENEISGKIKVKSDGQECPSHKIGYGLWASWPRKGYSVRGPNFFFSA